MEGVQIIFMLNVLWSRAKRPDTPAGRSAASAISPRRESRVRGTQHRSLNLHTALEFHGPAPLHVTNLLDLGIRKDAVAAAVHDGQASHQLLDVGRKSLPHLLPVKKPEGAKPGLPWMGKRKRRPMRKTLRLELLR